MSNVKIERRYQLQWTALAIAIAISLFAANDLSAAQGLVPYSGGNYIQSFDTLPFTSGTAVNTASPVLINGVTYTLPNTTAGTPFSLSDTTLGSGSTAIASGLDGWWSVGTLLNKLGAHEGSQTTGGLISFGGLTSSNRAIGLSATSTTGVTEFGLRLKNTSSVTYTQISVAFTSELWRQQTVAKTINFGYFIDTSGTALLPTSGQTADANLNSSFTTGTLAVLDGTLAANQSAKSDTISIGSWAPNQVLWLTWTISSNAGSAQEIAIDNLTFSANGGAPQGFAPYNSGNYTQNFDTLPFTSGTAVNSANPATINAVTYTLPAGGTPFSLSDTTLGSGSTAIASGLDGWWSVGSVGDQLGAQEGSQTKGGLISFGGLSSANRAIGLLGTSTSGITEFGLRMMNVSGTTYNQISLSFTSELWHQQTIANPINFGYFVDTTGTALLPASGQTAVPSLNSSFATGTSGAVDGTLAANQLALGVTNFSISNWAPNQVLWLTWTVSNSAGGAQGTGIDILTFSASVSSHVAPSIASFSPNLSYLVPQQVVTVAPNATITSGSANFNTGNLTLSFTANGVAAEDQLAIANVGTGAGQIGISGANVTFAGTTIGTFTGGTFPSPLVITFNASATPAAAQALLQNITYTDVAVPATVSVRTVQAIVDDGSGGTLAVSTPVSLTISVNPNPVIGNLSPATGEITIAYNGSVSLSGGAPPYSTPGFSSLPTGLTAGLSGGNTITLTGTPTQSGVFPGNISIKDNTGGTFTKPYTLTINALPSLGLLSQTQGTVNVPGFNGVIPINGGVSPFNSASVIGLPAGLGFALNGSQLAITGTPTQTGSFSLSASVKDANNLMVSQTFTLAINPLLPSPFVPGNLLLTKGVYTTPASTIVSGVTTLPNGATATADASYPFVFNNEGPDANFGVTNPLFIDQLTTDGTLVNETQVPVSVVSNSFSSKSEGAINLSTDRTAMTFVDYLSPPNALDVSNSNTPAVIEPGNTETTPPTFRAVVEMDLQGNFTRTTSNAYSGNNGRGAVKANGLYYVVGNAGNANGSSLVTNAAGAQIVVPGQQASSSTPGTIQTGFFDIVQTGQPADKPAKDNNFRGITIYNNTLYVTKGSGGNGSNTVYQVGNSGALPTLATETAITVAGPGNTPDVGFSTNVPINILPGFPTVSAKTGPVLYYPFGLWFANASTLYVSDEGDGVLADAANPGKSNGGLQKWIFSGGTWSLAYTLTNGLNLGTMFSVPNGPNGEVYPMGINPATGVTWTPANDGLRNIIGQTNSDGTVTIFAVTSTVSGATDQGADPNLLVSITDNPAFTTGAQAASEQFKVLKTAVFGEVLRGVALLPNPPVFNSVAAGDPTTSDVILWTRAVDPVNPVSVNLTVQVATDFNFTNIAITSNGNTDPAQDYTIKVDVTGLQAGTRYYYRFVGPYGSTSATGTFRTAYAAGTQAAVHFAFSGDCDGRFRPFPSTYNFADNNFDFFAFLGDTMYENAASPGPQGTSAAVRAPDINSQNALTDLRRKFRENISPVPGASSQFPGLQNFFAAQANYTLLDNHELCSNIGGNSKGKGPFQCGGAAQSTSATYDPTNSANDANATGSYANQQAGFGVCQQAFRNYEPIREHVVSAPGDSRSNGTQQMYLAQQWGKNLIFIHTDDRSYADQRMLTPTGADDTGSRADNPQRTRLGATQLAWLEQQLSNAQSAGTPWKIVTVSDPMDQNVPVGGAAITSQNVSLSDGGKSWMGAYRAERNILMKYIADNHIANVVFLATDDHLTRINELLYVPDPVNAPAVEAYVPTCFSIITGPIGASGPELTTDHSISNIQSISTSIASQEKALGVNPIGLDPAFPGLHDVVREGDPNANTVRQAFDFFSPDTFNYTTLDVGADGKTLTVSTFGINSYQVNVFPDPSVTGPVRQILSFQVDANPSPVVSISANAASGAVNSAILLSINSVLTNPAFPQTIAIQISNVPLSATLSAGTTTAGSGIWSLTTAQLTGLTITPTVTGSTALSVNATDLDGSNLAIGSATATLNLTVTLASQTITFNPLADLAFGASAFALTATASSGLSVGYSVTGPASLNGSTLSITGVGDVAVTASQPGNSNFSAAANVIQSFTVAPASAKIALSGLSATYDGTAKVVTAATTPAGLALTLTYGGASTAPTNAGSYAVVATITDPDFAGTSSATLVIGKATPIITWNIPASISFGTALSAMQLNATASVPGTFQHTPPAGTTLNSGQNQPLSTAFTPTDISNYNSASATVDITVVKANATIVLSGLSATFDGTAKAATATTTPSGLALTLTYGGASTSPTNAGSYTVVATITDPNYTGTSSGTLVIAKATPVITWNNPASITAGTAISATQLNATASVPGTFQYAPPIGTALNGGQNQPLLAVFTPTDISNYNQASATVNITVTGTASAVAPAITSGPTATPNPATVGQPVILFCAATGSTALSWKWDFGDGTSASNTGNSVTHVFSPVGTFKVTATATDTNNASAFQTLMLPVNAAVPAPIVDSAGNTIPNPLIDSDGDGFPDALEIALGSNPESASSTPFGGAPAGPVLTLPDVTLQIKLNFAKPASNDSIKFSSSVTLSDDFNISGKTLTIFIGGVAKSFPLTANGTVKQGNDSVKLSSGKGTAARTAKILMTSTKGTYAAAMNTYGLVNSTVTSTIHVPVIVLLGSSYYQEFVLSTYMAKAGKTGTATKSKK